MNVAKLCARSTRAATAAATVKAAAAVAAWLATAAWLVFSAPAHAEGPGQVSEPAPPEEIGHAIALNPAIDPTLNFARSVEAGLHSSTLSGGQPSWSGEYLKGTLTAGPQPTVE